MRFTRDTIPTPAIVIHLPTVEKNLRRTAHYAQSHGLKLRPHFKTHKSLFMAGLQLQAGAIGLTCAKVGEAECLRTAGRDILIAYPIVDENRAQRVAQLAQQLPVHVAVDSRLAVDRLAAASRNGGSTVGILIDVDVGFHRTGLQSASAALALAAHAASTPGTRLDGIFCYPGHIGPATADPQQALDKVQHLLAEVLNQLHRAGLETPIVSGGSTPSNFLSHLMPALTEIRPGTYIYNDHNTLAGGYCSLEDCAATIVTTVVSNAVPNKLIVDAGSKTLTSDRLTSNPAAPSFGLVLELPTSPLNRLSEEHGEIDLSHLSSPPKPGDRLTILPNHICPCINLQDAVWLEQADRSLTPLPTDARGRVI